MKKWLQKFLVFLVALLTFGLITPDHSIWNIFENGQGSSETAKSDAKNIDAANQTVEEIENSLDPIDEILQLAKEQSYIKFGSKIAPVIEEEFEERIFPTIEEVITSTLAGLDDERKQSLIISKKPGGNYSEKIFHIADGKTGKELLRFDVRTEKRPLDGYYYNFHYHTFEDEFADHHSIGDIFYSKNKPPKWLS